MYPEIQQQSQYEKKELQALWMTALCSYTSRSNRAAVTAKGRSHVSRHTDFMLATPCHIGNVWS